MEINRILDIFPILIHRIVSYISNQKDYHLLSVDKATFPLFEDNLERHTKCTPIYIVNINEELK